MAALFLQVLRGVEVGAGWWFIFYLLHRPPTRFRRMALVAFFAAGYVFWYLIPIDVWFAPDTPLGMVIGDDTVNEILWGVIVCSFALVCGNLRDSLFSALWYIGIEQCVDVLRALINRLLHDGQYVFNYPQFNVQYFLLLVWAVLYYRTRRQFTGAPPLLFQILTAATPLGATVFLTRLSSMIRMTPPYSDLRLYMCIEGCFIGSFILVINFIMFYLHIRLLLADAAKSFTLEVAQTPPVWTPEAGLSEAFCVRYSLSARERDVVEALLAGKTYKEIAESLFISLKTVETHLRNVYQKTKTANRFALYTLIKG